MFKPDSKSMFVLRLRSAKILHTCGPFAGYDADGVDGVALSPKVDDELRPGPVAPPPRCANHGKGGGHLCKFSFCFSKL